MGSIDADRWDIGRAEMLKARPHVRFLEEPVDLALADPVVLGTTEQPQPVQCASSV